MNIDISQAPALGSAANFALFSTNGAVSNAGLSQLIGKRRNGTISPCKRKLARANLLVVNHTIIRVTI